jgi:hypothetical protein
MSMNNINNCSIAIISGYIAGLIGAEFELIIKKD